MIILVKDGEIMKITSVTVWIVVCIVCVAINAIAGSPVNKTWFYGLAIKGYDPVAYFVDGQAVKGEKAYRYEWQGATWRFSSEEHKKRFIEDPEKYAPQYGGYCAWSVSQGGKVTIDPKMWKIVDGKLYLNFNSKVQEKWLEKMDYWIGQANDVWPMIKDK